MRILTCLFLWGTALASVAGASTKPPLHELVLPAGFRVHEASDGWGYALISRKSRRSWINESGVIVKLTIDDSHRTKNEKIGVHAQDYVDSIVRHFADRTVENPSRYTVSGKYWVCAPAKAKDPAKHPDMTIMIVELSEMAAIVQVGGKRDAWEETKRVTGEVMRLNSPPAPAGSSAEKSAR